MNELLAASVRGFSEFEAAVSTIAFAVIAIIMLINFLMGLRGPRV